MSRDGLSIREMEWHMDANMFLDEYPHWEAGGLHCLLIPQKSSSKPLTQDGKRQNE